MRKPFKKDYRLTQKWGANPEMYKRFGLKGHNGTDWGLPNGTEVLAPHDGRVIEKGNDRNGYGYYVKIENDEEGSILGHFKKILVNLRQEVKEGQLIALSNNTGFSTGPHLHWGYYRKPRNRNNGYSGTCDPFPFLKGGNMSEELKACLKDREKFWKERDEYKKEYDKYVDEAKKKIVDLEGEIRSLRTRNIEQQKQIEAVAEKLGTGKELGKILAAIEQGNNAVDAVDGARREAERVKKELEDYQKEVNYLIREICDDNNIPLCDLKGLREALTKPNRVEIPPKGGEKHGKETISTIFKDIMEIFASIFKRLFGSIRDRLGKR